MGFPHTIVRKRFAAPSMTTCKDRERPRLQHHRHVPRRPPHHPHPPHRQHASIQQPQNCGACFETDAAPPLSRSEPFEGVALWEQGGRTTHEQAGKPCNCELLTELVRTILGCIRLVCVSSCCPQ